MGPKNCERKIEEVEREREERESPALTRAVWRRKARYQLSLLMADW